MPGRLLLISLCFVMAMGSVKVIVDENPAVAGESVEFSIEAEGESAIFPDIRKIGEYGVTRQGIQRLERLEGNRTVVKWVEYYTFAPKKSVTIPPQSVLVDGKREWTRPLRLEVKKVSETLRKDFRLLLEIEKKEAFVGEPVAVTLRFFQKSTVPVMNVDFVPIKYENFWVKRILDKKEYEENGYRVTERRYLFFPQVSGDLAIGPAEVKIAMARKMRDAFGYIVRRPQWFSIVSESVKLHVEPLPEGVKYVGNFKIKTHAEPLETEAGRPVTLTVTVEARGNIEDFDLPSLHIEGVTVYPEDPKVRQRYTDGAYRGSWEKRYVLVGERSFTIPPLKLRYFDPEKNGVEVSESEPIAVKIIGGRFSESVVSSENADRGEEKSMVWVYLNLAAAFVAGMGVMYLLMRWIDREKKRGRKRVSPAGSESRMLQRLMPYISRSKEAAQMAENLYASIFEGRAVKIDGKEFDRLMERLRGGGENKEL